MTESFIYDDDGNLTGDSQFTYTWDAENRLTQVQRKASAVTAGASELRVSFTHDSEGRRIRILRETRTSPAASWTTVDDRRLVWDGWKLAGELDANGNVLAQYTWGLDLSGSDEGVGGIGGLLWQNRGTKVLATLYDGHGNVTGLADAALAAGGSGIASLTARYAYGPFGELLRSSGADAEANPFRYSTKYTHGEIGLVYYGYRDYQPLLGRWLSRDPLGEDGGLNIYGFDAGDPIAKIGVLGRNPVLTSAGTSGLVSSSASRAAQAVASSAATRTAAAAAEAGAMRALNLGIRSIVAAPVAVATTGLEIGLAGGQYANNQKWFRDEVTDSFYYATEWWRKLGSEPERPPSGGRPDFVRGGDGGGGTNASDTTPEKPPALGEDESCVKKLPPRPLQPGEQLDALGNITDASGAIKTYATGTSAAMPATKPFTMGLDAPEIGAGSQIGITGKIGEDALAQLGGEPNAFFRTSQGARYIDQFVNGIANEAKVGYRALTPEIRLQVMKDAELMRTQQIQGAIWNFYRSPVTGKIGPSVPLGDLLNQNNIPFVLHY